MICVLLASALLAQSGYQRGYYGATWSSTDTDLQRDLVGLACDADGVIYAAARDNNPYFLGETRQLQSEDGGASWRPMGGWGENVFEFPHFVRALAIDLAGRNLYAGTEQGIWQIKRKPREISRSGP